MSPKEIEEAYAKLSGTASGYIPFAQDKYGNIVNRYQYFSSMYGKKITPVFWEKYCLCP